MACKNKVYFLLVLVALLVGTSYAQEFNAYSSYSDIYACPCTTVDNNIYLSNSGASPYQIALTQEGDAAKWSTIYPSSVLLDPMESKTIVGIINVPCQAQGTYDLDTYLEDNLLQQKVLRQRLVVQDCRNTNLITSKTELTGCPCDPKVVEVDLTNTGTFIDIYDIWTEADDDISVSVSENNVILEPGETKKIYVYISNDCGDYGKSDFKVYAKSRYNADESSIAFSMDIQACYDFDVAFGEGLAYSNETSIDDFVFHDGKYHICEGTAKSIPFVIINKARIRNSYDIDMDAPGWAELQYNSIANLSYNRSFLNFIHLSPEQYLEGNSTFEFSIRTHIGGLEKEYEVGVDVQWCNTAILRTDGEHKVNFSENYLPVELSNMGYLNTTYELTIDGPEWVTMALEHQEGNTTEMLQVESVTVESGQTALLYARTSPANTTLPGRYDINITAAAAGQEYQTSTVIDLEKPGIISKIISIFLDFSLYILIGLILAAIIIYLLTRFLPAKGAEEKTEAPAKKEKVKGPEPVKEIVETTPGGIDLKPLLWILLILLALLAVAFLAWRYVPGMISAGNETAVNGTAINQTTVEQPVVEEPPEANVTEEPEVSFEGVNCSIYLYQNEKRTLNLSKSFVDPDGDALSFDYTLVPAHVNVTMDDGLVTLDPGEYLGVDYIEFSADDGQGGQISSGKLVICSDKPNRLNRFFSSIWNFIMTYRYYFLAGIIILLVVIAVMIFNERNSEMVPPVEEEKPAQKKKKKKKKKRKS